MINNPHINIYSKSESDIGRFLSNMHLQDIIIDGIQYRSIEHYWHYLKTYSLDKTFAESLLNIESPFEVLKKTRKFMSEKTFKPNHIFMSKILYAIEQKINENVTFKNKFILSYLPFEHYYVNGLNITNVKDKYLWLIEGISKIRKEMQENYLLDLKEKFGKSVISTKASGYDIIFIGRGSKFGNPFSHKNSKFPDVIKVDSKIEAIFRFREWFINQIKNKIITIAELKILKTHYLNCYCNFSGCSRCIDDLCHGLIIKEITHRVL